MTLSFLSMNRWTRLLAFAPLVAVFMLSGDAAPKLAAVDNTPTSVTFSVLTTGCGDSGTLNLTVGGVPAGSLGVTNNCSCSDAVTSTTTSDPNVLAAVGAPSCVDLSVAMNGSGYLSWAKVDINRNSGVETVCVFDAPGGPGNCAPGPDLCDSGYNYLPSGGSWSYAPPDTDGDGQNNCVDADLDGDGVDNAADFCPAIADPTNVDSDGDGIGNACQTVLRAVPWLGLANKSHEVYSGGELILQAVASLTLSDTPATLVSASWDPGDGSAAVSVPVTNPLALELAHTYTGADGQPYTAVITTTDSNGGVSTDTFKVVVKTKNIDVEANMAIDKGLWFIHKQLNRSMNGTTPVGFISGPSNIATTSGSVQAMQINNHVTTGNVAQDPYVHDASRMLRWLEAQIQVQPLSLQNGNNPDTNGNNIGLFANDNNVNYIVGQVMDAFVSSGTPAQTAVLGPAGDVQGRTYAAIIQDMMDFNSWSQMDVNAGQRGSWYYSASNNTSTGHADNSIAQWPAIGGIAGERVWGLTTPVWVKTEILGLLPYTYNTAANGSYSGVSRAGSFGYAGVNEGWSQNFATTPSALVQYVWSGVTNDPTPDTADEQKFRDGLGFMARWHRVLNPYTCCDTTFGGINFYALYATTKAYRLTLNEAGTPEPVTMVDDDPADAVPAWHWYYNDPAAGSPAAAGPIGVARAVIGNQQASGQFPGAGPWTGNLSTAWGVIILSPSLFQLGPTAVCTANPNQIGSFGGTVNFSGAGSFHNDDDGTIVSYAWDFGDSTSGTGSTASHAYPESATPKTFPATLTVTDSNGLTDTASCAVSQVNTNVQPNAEIGGPYNFCQGSPMIVSGAGSSDPEDGTAITYKWDFSSPINFTPADATTATVDITSIFGAVAPGLYNIGLQVTDSLGVTNAEFVEITVRAATDPTCNQPPDAVNDIATTPSGTPVTVTVLGNDTDPDVPAQTLTVTAATQGANGSVTTDGTTATYTPALGFFGVDTFTYTISDGRGGVDTATVTVTVNRRLATVTAGSGTKVYGDADPVLSPSFTGFLEAMTLTQTRVAGEDVGNYVTTATAAGATIANYEVTYIPGNLEITLKAATVTAGSGTKVYGDGDPSMSPSAIGFLEAMTLTQTRATGEAVGNYATTATASGATVGNYTVTYIAGNLAITKAPTTTTLTSTPSPQVAGSPVTLTATVTAVAPTVGVPNGTVTFMEGATVLGTAPVNGSGIAVLTTTSLANGPHSITAIYSGSSNYFASTSTAASQLIYGFAAGGGTFVIGNNNATLGNQVTFWGAQWEKLNSMTGGPSNASFKGYAISPAPPTVGATFTSAPGNSAPPPSAVPQYLGIIVTSKVTKSGSNITGTIVQLVVVQVNPGYAGNPGNAGTGTIVAILP